MMIIMVMVIIMLLLVLLMIPKGKGEHVVEGASACLGTHQEKEAMLQ